MNSTDPMHVDFENITKAVEHMKGVAEYVNNSIKLAENINKTLAIQSLLTGLNNLVNLFKSNI